MFELSLKKLITIIAALLITTALLILYIPPRELPSFESSPYQCTSSTKDKKRVLIFSSHGGGGHISAMNAIKEYLGDDYCVGFSFIFSDIFGVLDPVQRTLHNKVTGEDWYNFLLKRKWYNITNIAYHLGAWYYTFRQRTALPLLQNYLTKHRPDLIISVVPLVNNLILKAAKRMNIPLLIIPTDLDMGMAMNKLNNPQYDKLSIGLSYDDPMINNLFNKFHIDQRYLHYVGFPVKKGFFEPVNKAAIKYEFGIAQDKPIILLLMGAQGSQEIYEFTKQLAKLSIPAHIIIALGKSDYLKRDLQRIHFPKHITTTILGFTDRMADLMRISNLLITKSGSLSINEAIYAQLPMLLDGTSSVLRWEKFNHDYIVSHGFGAIIKRSYQIPAMVTRLLTNKELYDTMVNNLAMFNKPNPALDIRLLVKQIVAQED